MANLGFNADKCLSDTTSLLLELSPKGYPQKGELLAHCMLRPQLGGLFQYEGPYWKGNRFCTLHISLETQPSSLISGEISCKCRHALLSKL